VLGVCSGCALAYAATASRALAAFGDPIPVGTLKDYTADAISEKYIQHNFFVTRHKGRLFATVATCPHKQNFLYRNPKNPSEIICTGHDAVFDFAGKRISGPVRQGLDRFGIAVDDKGIVQVDTDKRFPEAKWNDAGSFIPLKTTTSTTGPSTQEQANGKDPTTSPESERVVPEKKDEVSREWSDATGTYKVEAYFISLANGLVKLKRADDGRLVDVPLDKLSDTDKEWVRSRRN
jgi:nitrite reductase/ring-hydroxylating ferredoxin subunit